MSTFWPAEEPELVDCPSCGGLGVYDDVVAGTRVQDIECRRCRGSGVVEEEL